MKLLIGNVKMDTNRPKFKMKKREMLSFNDDCDEAARHCPQFRGTPIEDRMILLGEITTKNLVKEWLSCEVLFGKGYCEYLSIDALEVFKRYEDHKAEKRIWNE